jgi:uncharacterized protein (TIGR02246 family)
MAFIGPLEDRIAIRELHDTYADAGFRGDMEQWLGCFVEDCAWVTPYGEMRGKEQLKATWDQIFSNLGALGFFTVMGGVEIDGDTATDRAYIREIFLAKDGAIQKLVGRYDDRLVREDGVWKFAKREYSVLIREGGE